MVGGSVQSLKYCCVVRLSFLLGLDLGLETQCSGPLCSCALLCRGKSQAREQRRVRSRLNGRSGRLSKRGRRDRVVEAGDV